MPTVSPLFAYEFGARMTFRDSPLHLSVVMTKRREEEQSVVIIKAAGRRVFVNGDRGLVISTDFGAAARLPATVQSAVVRLMSVLPLDLCPASLRAAAPPARGILSISTVHSNLPK